MSNWREDARKRVGPECPKCGGRMVKRTSARGEFYGCADFPRCRGSRNIDGGDTSAPVRKQPDAVYDPIPLMRGTGQQEAIWAFMRGKSAHIVVNAGPGCLVGDTLIDCPRNMAKYPAGIPIKDLVGQTPYVYGYSEKLRRIVVRRAVRVWKTGEHVPVYKVTFRRAYSPSTNKQAERPPLHVIGTADHPFLLRVPPHVRKPGWNVKPPIPGGWRMLTDLQPGDRVIAFLREFNQSETRINLNNGKSEIESRFILSEIAGRRGLRYHAHHRNGQHLDHTPDNLQWKTRKDHVGDHTRDLNLAGKTGWQKTGIHPRGMAGKPQTDKQRRIASLTHRGKKKTPIHVARMRAARWGETNHIVEKVEFYGHADVYNMTVEDCQNFVANGVVTHNTGKTWTSVQGCLRTPKSESVLFVAFNRHIAEEANGKLRASGCSHVTACTYHSLGYRILRAAYPSLGAPSQDKVKKILEHLSPCPDDPMARAEWRRGLNMAAKLVTMTKNYLLDFRAPGYRDEVERVADHHGLDLNGQFEAAFALTVPALDECLNRMPMTIDFDDMIWGPVVLGLPYEGRCDLMITDESQDLNAAQHAFALRFAEKSRLMVVGDRRQAIYGFRGALTSSIEALAERLAQTDRGVEQFPLTITMRCPRRHVELARAVFPGCAVCGCAEDAAVHGTEDPETHQFVPTLSAADDAPDGEVRSMREAEALDAMQPGDMVICRTNAPLIPAAYGLIGRGVRPVIKGRDIGEGLIALLDTLEKMAARDRSDGSERVRLRTALATYSAERSAKLLDEGEKAAGRLAALQDKVSCMAEFLSRCDTAAEVRARIESIFSDDDPTNAVVLGTVHRTKGLEALRVFILRPNLIPHPAAKKDWEMEQERNLAWVAVTRAKFDRKTETGGVLVFCGALPAIYEEGGAPSIGGKVGDTRWVRSAAQRACADHRQLTRNLRRENLERAADKLEAEDEPPF